MNIKNFDDFVSFSDDSEPISYFSILPPETPEIIRMTDIILEKSDDASNLTEHKIHAIKMHKQKLKNDTTNRSTLNKQEMKILKKKIKKNKTQPFYDRSNKHMRVKHLIRRTNHFCKNKTVYQFVNAWRLNIGYDRDSLIYNEFSKRSMMELELDIKYIFPKGLNFDTGKQMIRVFDFGMPTDPYYYGASYMPRAQTSCDYALEYIKHKKAFSITAYKDTKKYKIKLQELTHNFEFADARQKSALKFVQMLKSLNSFNANNLANSIIHTIDDLRDAYKYQRYKLKENGIFFKTNIKLLGPKTLKYIESMPYICFKYDSQPDFQYAPFITEIYVNDKFCNEAKFKPILSDGLNGLKIIT